MPEANDPYGVSEVWGDDDDGPMPPPFTIEGNDTTTGQPASIPVVTRSFDVCVFNSALDNVPKPLTMTLSELRASFKEDVDGGLVNVVVTGDKKHDDPVKKAGRAFSMCRYKPGTERKKENVVALSGFVMDIDNPDEAGINAVFGRIKAAGLVAVAWTTWGSGWAKQPQAWRVVVLFATDVDANDWPAAWLALTATFAPANDPATKNADRIFFLPRAPAMVPDGQGGKRANDAVRWWENDGALFDPTDLVREARQEGVAKADERAVLASAQRAVPSSSSSSSLKRPDKVTRAQDYADEADPSLSGQGGHANAMRVVGVVVRLFDLNDSEAMQALARWNARCVPPWSDIDLRHKINEAQTTSDPQGRPRGFKLKEDRAPPSTSNLTNHKLASGGIGENAANDDVDEAPIPWLIPADEFCAQSQAVPWLVKRWVQAGALMMAHGPSGCGKTFVVLDWCCRIASDVDDWCGARVASGAVVYLAGEGHQGLRGRLAAWKLHNSVDTLDMFVSPEGCDLNTDAGLARVIAAIDTAATRPVLVVVDTLHRFLDGDEDKAQDARGMIDACGKLIARYGCAVMLVHHTGHSEEAQKRGRGSSSWRGALDVEISVVAKDGGISLIQRKSKDAELAPSVFVRLQQVTLPGVVDEDGFAVSSAVVVAADSNGEASQKEGGMRAMARVLAAFDEPSPSGWLSLQEIMAFANKRREDVIEACDLLVSQGVLTEAPHAPNAKRLFSKQCPFPVPTLGVGTTGTAGVVPGTTGTAGTAKNSETSAVPGTAGNSGNDEIVAAIIALFSTPGAHSELSTAAIAKLIHRKHPDITAAVLASADAFKVTTTAKGERLVKLREQETVETAATAVA